ncbi:hypothetical protein ACJJTC_018237 [Scirpophaga incertulas]
MPKHRKEKGDLEYYIQKIRKIEDRMKRRHRRRRIDSNSTDKSTDTEIDKNEPNAEMVASNSPISLESLQSEKPCDSLQAQIVESENINPVISTEVLLALGDLMPEKPKFGPPINKDIANLWTTILKSGLHKEYKEKLMEQLIPENCPLLQAPKLNPEIMSSVPDSLKNRDKKIELEQQQLGMGISIITNTLTQLITSDEIDKIKIITMLSDAGRIFTDLHFTQTKTRRNLLFPSLDKTFLEAIKDIERDEYLYGSNLTEKIKTIKNCQRSGQSIKKSVLVTNSRSGNLSGPPRHRTAARYGPKKYQSSSQSQKFHNTAKQFRANQPYKRHKMPQEKLPART